MFPELRIAAASALIEAPRRAERGARVCPLGGRGGVPVGRDAPGMDRVSRRGTVHLPGGGFLTEDGNIYSDEQVRTALLSICEWWVGLSAEERAGLLEVAELAEIDRNVDAAVFGEAT